MEHIDFTGAPILKRAYPGTSGSKLSIMYNGRRHMLKFSSMAACFSEYLGCHIFDSIGIPVQQTILGMYNTARGTKIVVACGDVTTPGIILQDFASLKNQMIDSERSGYGTELSDILDTIHTQSSIDPEALSRRFWDMFIIDALIGNWDRHNGNWGFLYNTITDSVSLAPVFDCGSCLYPQVDETLMQEIVSDKSKMDYRIYEIPTSAITENGKRVKYFNFLTSLSNSDCNAALRRIVPRIDMRAIKSIIDDMPIASTTQKEFYFEMLKARKERILDVAMSLL